MWPEDIGAIYILIKLMNIYFFPLFYSDDIERTIHVLPCNLMSLVTVDTLTKHTQLNNVTLDLFLFIFSLLEAFTFLSISLTHTKSYL